MEQDKIKQIKQELDYADVFLRDRVNSKSAPLNEYDKAIMLDIANTCDEAVKLISHYESETERLSDLVLECIDNNNEWVKESCQLHTKLNSVKRDITQKIISEILFFIDTQTEEAVLNGKLGEFLAELQEKILGEG